jgi:hypothetical protein
MDSEPLIADLHCSERDRRRHGDTLQSLKQRKCEENPPALRHATPPLQELCDSFFYCRLLDFSADR